MQRLKSTSTIIIGKSFLTRQGIARLLRASSIRTIASVSCVEDLPSTHLLQTHLLFLIVYTGEDFDGLLQQIEALRDLHPTGHIVVVADHCKIAELVSAFRVGAKGYFVNPMNCDVLVKSIEAVMMGATIFLLSFLSFTLAADSVGEMPLRDDVMHSILIAAESKSDPHLSPRERLILHHLIEGGSNKSIARKVKIAESTVKVHVKAILRKIRAKNRTQAAIWAMNNESLARSATAIDGPSETHIKTASATTKTAAPHSHPGDAPATQNRTRFEERARTPTFELEKTVAQSDRAEVPAIDRSIRKRITGEARS